MGFKRTKIFVLEFDDPEFEGLEVRCRGASVAGVLSLIDLGDLFSNKKVDIGQMKEIDNLFRTMGGCPNGCEREHRELIEAGLKHYENRIVSWNWEDDDGVPYPASFEGLKRIDLNDALTLVFAWLNAAVGTPDPLERNWSGGGDPEGVESIPMAIP